MQDAVCHPVSHTINNFLVSANWVRIPVFSFQLTPGFFSSVLGPILWEISYLPRTDAIYYPGRSRVTRLVYTYTHNTHIHIYTYTHIHIYTYTHIHIYTYIHIYAYTHIHVYTYLHIHIYKHIHTHTELTCMIYRKLSFSAAPRRNVHFS